MIKDLYGLNVHSCTRLSLGAGSNTYILDTDKGRYLLKNPSKSSMNTPELEPALCSYLLSRGIPACQFIPSLKGEYICHVDGQLYHLQRFIEGKTYDLNTAPEWLMRESAAMLGRIHTALKDYKGLPVGIGQDFFKFMTPERAAASYEKSLRIAEESGDTQSSEDLRYRLKLMERFPVESINLSKLTCSSTHGDYFISQIICGEDKINAVIDWTTACVHPLVWEIIRSFVYAEPSCREGIIETEKLVSYLQEYLKHASLKKEDIYEMPGLFFYQIGVCDYYGQYYNSEAENRSIYLHQALFSTRLMKWFEENLDMLTNTLVKSF